jgi:hypothetical protein
MRGRHSTLLGIVIGFTLLTTACGSTETSTSTDTAQPEVTTEAATEATTGESGTLSDPENEANQAVGRRMAAGSFWRDAIQTCNEWSADNPLFDGSADDPTVDVEPGEEVTRDVFLVVDKNGVQLLVDLAQGIVTGLDGPDGVMPRPYLFGCPETLFVGTFDEGPIDDEANPGDEDGDGIVFGLDADGLGTVDFLADPDNTLIHVTAALGEPDEDSGLVDGYQFYGICPGPQIRIVRWGNFEVAFAYPDGEDPFFFQWRVPALNGDGSPAPTTPEGIGIGSTVADLQAVYGDAITVEFSEDFDLWSFDPTDNTAFYGDGLNGAVTGGDPTDTIQFITAGQSCAD